MTLWLSLLVLALLLLWGGLTALFYYLDGRWPRHWQ